MVVTENPVGRDVGEVWDTNHLSQEFEVMGFSYNIVMVKRKSDGVSGTLMFEKGMDDKRYYHTFVKD